MIRVGIGYDSHRFAPAGRWSSAASPSRTRQGLVGHSDGDAIAHALTDAMLGAAALGDIGEMFPDTDPAGPDADSIVLLRRGLLARLRAAGWIGQQCDVTVVAEAPKIAPHRAAMRDRLADGARRRPADVSREGKDQRGDGLDRPRRRPRRASPSRRSPRGTDSRARVLPRLARRAAARCALCGDRRAGGGRERLPAAPGGHGVAFGASLAARRHRLRWTVFAVTLIGNLAGAMCMYWVGARHAAALFRLEVRAALARRRRDGRRARGVRALRPAGTVHQPLPARGSAPSCRRSPARCTRRLRAGFADEARVGALVRRRSSTRVAARRATGTSSGVARAGQRWVGIVSALLASRSASWPSGSWRRSDRRPAPATIALPDLEARARLSPGRPSTTSSRSRRARRRTPARRTGATSPRLAAFAVSKGATRPATSPRRCCASSSTTSRTSASRASIRRNITAVRTYFRFLLGGRAGRPRPERAARDAEAVAHAARGAHRRRGRAAARAPRRSTTRSPSATARCWSWRTAPGSACRSGSTLRLRDVCSSDGLVRVFGKGRKERLVPIGGRRSARSRCTCAAAARARAGRHAGHRCSSTRAASR